MRRCASSTIRVDTLASGLDNNAAGGRSGASHPRLKLELIKRAVAAYPRDRGHALSPRIKAAIGRTTHPAAIVGAPWSGLRLTRVERQSDKRDQYNRDDAHDGDLLLAGRVRPTVICRFPWLRFAILEYLPIAAWRVAAGLGFSCFAGLGIHRLVGLGS